MAINYAKTAFASQGTLNTVRRRQNDIVYFDINMNFRFAFYTSIKVIV